MPRTHDRFSGSKKLRFFFIVIKNDRVWASEHFSGSKKMAKFFSEHALIFHDVFSVVVFNVVKKWSCVGFNDVKITRMYRSKL